VAASIELAGLAGLGSAPLGSGPGWEIDWGPADPAHGQSVVRAAVQAGVGWIDTAPFYGWGQAEKVVGTALRGVPHRPALLTKCGTVPRPGGSAEDHRAATIRADLDASLARLGCESVDVLQLHDPDPAVPVETAWQTVCELIAAGKAGAGGLSNHPVELMDRAAAIGPVAVVQHQYSLLRRAPEADGVLEWCAGHGAVFLAWSPLASGFLADGFDVAALSPGDFRRRSRLADPSTLDLAGLRRGLGAIAGQAGMSMAALAVGWVLARGARAIVGARSPAEARQIRTYQPLPPDIAAAAEDAADRAWTNGGQRGTG
jgi:aryl-alcohol dehydrogenase-like predicted oxidoreductase